MYILMAGKCPIRNKNFVEMLKIGLELANLTK